MQERARESGGKVLVVVSALSGVTNALQALIDAHADAAAVAAGIETLIERHRAFCAECEVDAEHMAPRFEALRALGTDPRRESAALDWQAEILAQGELLSSTLGAAYLRSQGVPVHWLDARDALRAVPVPNASAWASRLSVSCDYADDSALRERLAAQGDLFLSQGFIARATDGGTAILGRGGSDTSAAYFGALLGAERVEIWTDVPGMFSANPRAVPQARLLSQLDYEEAQEIATTGAKVLHPRCIHPCREARVPLWIKDTERPQMDGTRIDDRAETVPGVKAISTRKGIVLVSMETIGMWQQVGFLSEVFAHFRRHGLSVDLIGSAETNVTVSLDPSENLVNSNVLDALCADLAQVCRVKVIAPCSAITLVGRGMRSLLHQLTDVWNAFGRERVHLISQSSNDLNLTFVVDEALADDLLPTLHQLLIDSGAMPVEEHRVFGPSWTRISAGPVASREPWWMRQRGRLLAAAQGTPRYVYSLPELNARAAAVQALRSVDQCFYAIKANAHPQILKTLAERGFGLECVSLAEIAHVKAHCLQLPPARILFTPSFAPIGEYAAALDLGVSVTVDNLELLRQAPEVFRGRELFLRIDPGFGQGHHAKVRTGGKESKFGLAVEDVEQFLQAARAIDSRVIGLHAHIGSGIFDVQHWAQVYAQLVRLADRIGSVRSIDIGGGMGIPYREDQDDFDWAAFDAALAPIKQAWPQYALWIEPGRYLVAEAGVLLARVTQVVRKQGVRRVGLDAGMHSLLRPALYEAWHDIVNLTRFDAAPGSPAEVVGPICESSDVLGHRRPLPETTAAGDIVLIADAGAYGAVMASRYNLRALPAEDVWDD